MDAPERGALMLVRFIAIALIGVSLVEFALYYVISQHNQTPMQAVPCMLKSIPAVLGIAGLIRSRPLAEWLAELFD